MQSITIDLQPTPELLDSFRAIVRSELANYKPPIPEGPELPELLTRNQTAKLLQVSLTTLFEWSRDTADRPAILVAHKINSGRVRYHRSDVLALVRESRKFKTADEPNGSLTRQAYNLRNDLSNERSNPARRLHKTLHDAPTKSETGEGQPV